MRIKKSLEQRRDWSFILIAMLMFLVLNLSMIAIFSLSFNKNYQAEMVDSIVNYSKNMIAQSIDYTDNSLKGHISLLRGLTGNRYTRSLVTQADRMTLENKLTMEQRVFTHIRSIKDSKPDLLDIIIVGDNGYLYNDDARASFPLLSDFSEADWYLEAKRNARDGLVGIDIVQLDFYSQNTEEYMRESIMLSMPIQGYSGGAVGMAFLLIDRENRELSQYLFRNVFSEDYDVFLIDGSNKVLLDSRGAHLGEVIDIPQYALGIGAENAETQLPKGAEELWVITQSRFANCSVASRASLAAINKQTVQLRVRIVFMMGCALLINVLLSFALYHYLKRSITRLMSDLDRMTDCEVTQPQKWYRYTEFNFMSARFNTLLARIKTLTYSNYLYKLERMRAQLSALISQINPHFLFNTLQMIQAEVMYGDRVTADSALVALGDMLRYSTDAHQNQYVSIGEELRFTQTYLDIMQKLYPHRLHIDWDIGDDVESLMCPRFLIQPIVENSVKHGFQGAPDGNRLLIRVHYTGECISAMIEDDGSGITPEEMEKLRRSIREPMDPDLTQSIGLVNISQRIMLLYGEQASIEIDGDAGRFFRVSIRIPAQSSMEPFPE